MAGGVFDNIGFSAGMFGPFKCPDCGVWWAGFEHRCTKPTTTIGTGGWVPPTGSGSSTPLCGKCGQFKPNNTSHICNGTITVWYGN